MHSIPRIGIFIAIIVLTSCQAKHRSGESSSSMTSANTESDLKVLLGQSATKGVLFELDDYYREKLAVDGAERNIILNEVKGILYLLKSRYARCFDMHPQDKFRFGLSSDTDYFKLEGARAGYFAWYTSATTGYHFRPEAKELYKNEVVQGKFLQTLGYCSSQQPEDSDSSQWVVSKMTSPEFINVSSETKKSVFGTDVFTNISVESKLFSRFVGKSATELKATLALAKSMKRQVQVVVFTRSGTEEKFGAIQICEENAATSGVCY